MHFALSQDQLDLAEAVAGVLDRHYSREVMRAEVDGGTVDRRDLWRRIDRELGLSQIAVPETLGGVGGTVRDLMVVAEQAGAHLLDASFLMHAALAPVALSKCGGPASADLLARINEGDVSMTVALSSLVTALRLDADRVDATIAHVPAAATSDVLLARAGDSLVAIDLHHATVAVEAESSLDQTRPLARVTLTSTPVTILAPITEDLTSILVDTAALLFAAESVGVTQACLSRVVEHTTVREQFGRPLASFQAVKHRCADVYLALETSRAQTWYAAWAIDEDTDDRSTVVAAAVSAATTAAEQAAAAQLQLVGGIAYTWEHDAHLFYKRAVTTPALVPTLRPWHDVIVTGALGLAG